MNDTLQVVLGLVFLVAVFIGTRYFVAIRLQNAAKTIIQDLERQNALTEVDAVVIPYSTPNILRIGMRDYRRKALEYMVSEGVIGSSADGKYYLKLRASQDVESKGVF